MSRYFITGAQGFVGRYLVAHLLSSDATTEVIGLGRSTRSDHTFTHTVRCNGTDILAPLPRELRPGERYRYAAGDIRNGIGLIEQLRSARPDVVIHLASGLRDDPAARLFETNVEGSIALLEAIRESGASPKRVIMGSTGGVYGRPRQLPLAEDAPCDPIDPYCASKLAAEQASRTLAGACGLPLIWARLFNLVGPGQDERHICGRLASHASAIRGGLVPPVIEVGALDATRDMIDVRDVASALVLIAEQGEVGATYNVASGIECAMQVVVETVVRLAGLAGRVEVRQTRFRAGDIPRHYASTNRLRALGFSCVYDLEQSIRDVLRYYTDHTDYTDPSV